MTETLSTIDHRSAAAMRRLVRDLRNAGWRHTVTWDDTRNGRDLDGAPYGPMVEVHTWRRGDEIIEGCRDEANSVDFSDRMRFAYWREDEEGEPFAFVPEGLVARIGPVGLHRLAVAIDAIRSEPLIQVPIAIEPSCR